MKEIQFSSRTRSAADEFRRIQTCAPPSARLMEKMPPELLETPAGQAAGRGVGPAVYNIIQLIYRSPTCEGIFKDYEFSRRTMEDHWKTGQHDPQRRSSTSKC